jgi:Antitoxin Xre/MbcA/ParS C-terminal toxin-binding domain
METRETEIIREVMLSAIATPIDEAELRKFVAKVHQVLDVWRENAAAIDQQIVDFHYRRRMRFAEIAAAVGITESSARRWSYRLLAQVADLLQERVRSDEQLASFAPLTIENHDAFRLTVSTFLSVQKIGPETTSAEMSILRQAVQTFGSHADAVHWLLDDCPALNGRPIDLLIDARGVKDVENVLGCIDHGLIF